MRGAIRKQLLLLTAAPFILLLFTIFSVSFVHRSTSAAQDALLHADAVIEAAQSMRAAIDDVQRGARLAALRDSRRNAALYAAALRDADRERRRLRSLVGVDSAQAMRYELFERLTRRQLDVFAGDVAGAHAGKRPVGDEAYANPTRIRLARDWRAAFAAFVAAQNEIKADRRKAVLVSSTTLSCVLAVAVIFGIINTIALSLAAGQRFVGRLQELNENATRAAAGEAIGDSMAGDDEISKVDAHIRMLLTRLAERERRLGLYRLLAGRTRDIMFFVSDGRIFEANESAVAAYGYARDAFVGIAVEALDAEGDGAAFAARSAEIGDRDNVVFETAHMRADGSVFPVEVTASYTELEGRPLYLCIVRDVTERRRTEASLKAAVDRANEASRFKSEFVASMSHEIRTPMNAILGMTELLLGTTLDEEQFEFTSAVRSSSESLMRIINDVLDFSKIEAGKLDIESAEFDLAACVESVADLLALQARRKGIVLTCFVDPQIGALVRGDAVRIRQVLLNLASNAVKFTESGEIALSAALDGTDETAMNVRFAVRDSGIGVPAELRQRLFQPFTQADGSTTRRYGGTGLGLAISRHLVELMGGEIGVSGVEGGGSLFWFTLRLPLGIASALAHDHPIRGMRALVVDAESASRSALVRYLRAWGITTHERSVLAEAEPGFDVAFVDCTQLGDECFRFPGRREAGHPLAGVPLVLTAAVDVPPRGRSARAAGYAAYLVKPFRQSLVFDALALFAEANEPPDCEETPRARTLAAPAPRRTARILLVEDNPVNRRLACKQLEKLGYGAIVAENGRRALDVVRLDAFDLILMDCHMPEMDGFAATRAIRKMQSATGKRTPIVAMTADARPEDRAACLAADMDDYLSKPVGLAALEATLARWLPHETEPAERTSAANEG